MFKEINKSRKLSLHLPVKTNNWLLNFGHYYLNRYCLSNCVIFHRKQNFLNFDEFLLLLLHFLKVLYFKSTKLKSLKFGKMQNLLLRKNAWNSIEPSQLQDKYHRNHKQPNHILYFMEPFKSTLRQGKIFFVDFIFLWIYDS